MISSAKSPATSTSSTPATPATPATNVTTDAVDSPFDAILTLESLVATCNAIDPKLADGGLENLADSGLAEGDDADPADGVDAEDPLAFLASLLNPIVTPPVQAAGAAGAGSDDALDDVMSGHVRQVAVPGAETPILLVPQDAADDAGVAAVGGIAGAVADATDAAKAQKLLAAMIPATTLDPNATRGDAAQATDAATLGLARAVEMLGHGPRHTALPSQDVIPTPVRDPHWAQDFSARVSMMVRGGESNASLQLSPIDLGPVDVNVTVRDSQTTIHFGAAQAETRALIEASIPRLREMLAAQGFNLMDASVSQGFARQSRSEVRMPSRADAEPELEVRATTSIGPLGLLDMYA